MELIQKITNISIKKLQKLQAGKIQAVLQGPNPDRTDMAISTCVKKKYNTYIGRVFLEYHLTEGEHREGGMLLLRK